MIISWWSVLNWKIQNWTTYDKKSERSHQHSSTVQLWTNTVLVVQWRHGASKGRLSDNSSKTCSVLYLLSMFMHRQNLVGSRSTETIHWIREHRQYGNASWCVWNTSTTVHHLSRWRCSNARSYTELLEKWLHAWSTQCRSLRDLDKRL